MRRFASAPILRETASATFTLRSTLEAARARVVELERQVAESEEILRDAFDLFKTEATTPMDPKS